MDKEPKNKVSISYYLCDDLVRIPQKSGSVVILDRTYYEDGGMSDLAEKPCKFWVFTRHFTLSVGKTGKPTLKDTRDVVEISGKTNKQMRDNLEAFVDSLYGMVPQNATKEWIPEDFTETKKAVASGALKI